jgi:hypothetical protein
VAYVPELGGPLLKPLAALPGGDQDGGRAQECEMEHRTHHTGSKSLEGMSHDAEAIDVAATGGLQYQGSSMGEGDFGSHRSN